MDFSPERCLASDITSSELTDGFILAMRMGKFRNIETAEATCRCEAINIQLLAIFLTNYYLNRNATLKF